MVAATEYVLASVPDPESMLTDMERRRAVALHRVDDRDDFVAAHVLVRLCAATLTGTDPRSMVLEQHCPTCGQAHGKPTIAGLDTTHISLSHSGGWVAAAAAAKPVGVDVEVATRFDPTNLPVGPVLTTGERSAVEAAAQPVVAFMRLWTRKEALVKVGLARLGTMRKLDLGQLPVDDPPSTGRTLAFAGRRLSDVSIAGGNVVAATASRADVRFAELSDL